MACEEVLETDQKEVLAKSEIAAAEVSDDASTVKEQRSGGTSMRMPRLEIYTSYSLLLATNLAMNS
jgi:hypothetical protein